MSELKNRAKKIKTTINAVKYEGKSPKEASELTGIATALARKWLHIDALIRARMPKSKKPSGNTSQFHDRVFNVDQWITAKEPKDFEIEAKFWTYEAIEKLIEQKVKPTKPAKFSKSSRR